MVSERVADILAVVVLLLMIFCVVAVPTISLGIGLGYGLHALIPGLDLGWAMVAGAVFAVGIVDMAARLLIATREREQMREQGDLMADEPWLVLPRGLLPYTGRRRGKKRK